MARRRFFVPEIHRGTAELTGADAEHLVRVLRAEVGQIYEISDNQNLFLAEIQVARKSVVSFQIKEKLPPPVPSVAITLLAALFKFDHFEWLVEKATELGVTAIQPFEATRTERGLAQASGKRRTRWERIALEASQQSRRAHLPIIHPTVRFAKALEAGSDVRLLLDEAASAPPLLRQLPEERSASDNVSLLLGPEGGWTDEERATASRAGWLPTSLGPAILRAETAGVAGLAIVQAAWTATPAVE
jgi:16S rRNA (uracil1498-N3)-methyltransferase